MTQSGINRRFYITISSRFAKQLSYVKNYHRCSHIGIAMELLGHAKMGSFLFIVVRLYSYIDSDVGNLRKNQIFLRLI